VQTSTWILGDQLLATHPALQPGHRVVIIESLERLRQRPAHAHKLGLLLAAMRHYAAALRQQGYDVDLRQAPDFVSGLREHLAEMGSTRLVTMAAAEYDTRQMQQTLGDTLGVETEVLPNTQFLIGRYPPRRSPKRMETFYRDMRRATGLLLTAEGEPVGGAWNFDKENRAPYDGRPIPAPRQFAPDELTRAALDDVARLCPDAIGSTAGFALPVTRAQAQAALEDFITHRLPDFGRFEDAMSSSEGVLFHSRLSPLVNIGLLEPLEMAQAAAAAYEQGAAPLNSVEGFVRQVIGWREYMYMRYWEQMPDLRAANAWEHTRPLPAWFWSGDTRMNCLHHALRRALDSGYAHHIERLMLLCNFAMLAGLAPLEVNDWFLACFFDAYDWVMLPNVLGMGLHADNGTIATKPYIASASYIHRMSDYCGGCAYNRKARHGADACPFNVLYWNFLLTHEQRLRANPRSGPAVLALRHLDNTEREAVQQQAAALLADLDRCQET
jgi:deoxyribodipyrimidine photolyase-related protein